MTRDRWIAAVSAGVVLSVLAGFVSLRARTVSARPQTTPAAATGAETPEVRVARAETRTIRRGIDLPGTVEPVRVARLASPAEGPVERVWVREGDRVSTGQRLVRVGRRRASDARVAADRAELRKAEDELERVRRLVDRGAVPGEWLDRAVADTERARAAAEAGGESAGDHDVFAPWPGVVSRVLVSEGNFVAPRTVLVEVFDPRTLNVRVALPEAVAMTVPPGAAARVTLDALPGSEYEGRVSRLYPELDRRLRTRTAEIALHGDPALAPGMFARVDLAVETVEDAVVLPAAALVGPAGDQRAVFVVSGGKAQRRSVSPGLVDGDRVQIRSGVAPGEEVAITGQAKLVDGEPVRAKASAPVKAAERSVGP